MFEFVCVYFPSLQRACICHINIYIYAYVYIIYTYNGVDVMLVKLHNSMEFR